MKKLFLSTLVISGLTLTGVSSLALNEQSKDAPQTEQHMQKEAEHGVQTENKVIRGQVTKVQDSAIEIKDEAGKTHSFDTTGLQNLEELRAEALQPGDVVRVEIKDGQAALIEKVEAKSDASSEDSSTTANANGEENEAMKQDVEANKETGASSAEGKSEMASEHDTFKDESSMPADRQEGAEQAEIAGTGEYIVKEGDTLGGIAEEQLGSQEDWRIIARANNLENPDMIYVGQHLTIPSDANSGSKQLDREEAPDSGNTEPMKDNTDSAPTAPGSY